MIGEPLQVKKNNQPQALDSLSETPDLTEFGFPTQIKSARNKNDANKSMFLTSKSSRDLNKS